jgi:hypothetical protein
MPRLRRRRRGIFIIATRNLGSWHREKRRRKEDTLRYVKKIADYRD